MYGVLSKMFILAMATGLAAAPAAEPTPSGSSAAAAATKQAVRNLYDDICRVSLGRNLTVGDFVLRTGASEQLSLTLQRAEQVGGVRWIDDRTCQVELQISGARVTTALQRAAAAAGKDSPLTLGEINRACRDWSERTFTATATAVSTTPVAQPSRASAPQRDPWAGVSNAAKEQVINAAKLDAAQRSLKSVSPITLTPRSTVGDVLLISDVGSGMEKWFTTQPVTSVDLRYDLRAEVTLAATPVQAFDTFRGLATKQRDVPLPPDDSSWSRVKGEFSKRMVTPIGRGAVGEAPRTQPRPLVVLRRPPAWVGRRLEAEAAGDAQAGRSKLLSARAAEAAAEQNLAAAIHDLPMNDGRTLGQLSKEVPAIADAIHRAARRARIARTEYREDGSARVVLYVDGADIWHELTRQDR